MKISSARIAAIMLIVACFGFCFSIKQCAVAEKAKFCGQLIKAGKENTPQSYWHKCHYEEMTVKAVTAETDKTEALMLLGAWAVLGMIAFARVAKEEGI